MDARVPASPRLRVPASVPQWPRNSKRHQGCYHPNDAKQPLPSPLRGRLRGGAPLDPCRHQSQRLGAPTRDSRPPEFLLPPPPHPPRPPPARPSHSPPPPLPP